MNCKFCEFKSNFPFDWFILNQDQWKKIKQISIYDQCKIPSAIAKKLVKTRFWNWPCLFRFFFHNSGTNITLTQFDPQKICQTAIFSTMALFFFIYSFFWRDLHLHWVSMPCKKIYYTIKTKWDITGWKMGLINPTGPPWPAVSEI